MLGNRELKHRVYAELALGTDDGDIRLKVEAGDGTIRVTNLGYVLTDCTHTEAMYLYMAISDYLGKDVCKVLDKLCKKCNRVGVDCQK